MDNQEDVSELNQLNKKKLSINLLNYHKFPYLQHNTSKTHDRAFDLANNKDSSNGIHDEMGIKCLFVAIDNFVSVSKSHEERKIDFLCTDHLLDEFPQLMR